MILYGSTLSPFVRKAVAFAAEKGVAVELRQIGLGSTDAEFLAASPLGKIPALRDGDFTLADSTAIAFYLDAVGAGPALIPADARARARTIWWDEFADTELFAPAGVMFFNRLVSPLFLRTPGDEAAAAAAETRLPRLLNYVETAVPDPGAFLVGDALTLADLALTSLFVNLAHLEVSLAGHPRTAAWVERMLTRPSFAAMVEKERRMIMRARAG